MTKTIKISDKTHKELKIYQANNGLRTLGNAIDRLLKKAGLNK